VAVATGIAWRLADGVVPPGGSGLAEVLEGAWSLAVCGFRQVVWI